MKYRLPVILLMSLVSGCAALPASVLDSDAISELAVPSFSGGLSASREHDDLGETTGTYSLTLDVS